MYTCDTDTSTLTLEDRKPSLNRQQQKNARVRHRLSREKFKESIQAGEIAVSDLFSTDADLIEMRKPFTQQFFTAFKRGFTAYEAGQWKEAQKWLQESIQLR